MNPVEIVIHIVTFIKIVKTLCKTVNLLKTFFHLVHVTRSYRNELPTFENSPESKTTDYAAWQLKQTFFSVNYYDLFHTIPKIWSYRDKVSIWEAQERYLSSSSCYSGFSFLCNPCNPCMTAARRTFTLLIVFTVCMTTHRENGHFNWLFCSF